jgi:precorrin-3B C17-methyltransferase
LSGDFAVISLSDLLTPLEVIEKRLDAVFSIGIPVVIYNPRSHGRPDNFALAMEHARKYYPLTVPIAIIKNALRNDGTNPVITTLGAIEKSIDEIDMHTTVIIGGTESRIWRMENNVKGIITPRGYHRKYLY